MALFGGERDVSMVRHINKELINDIINTEVAIFQLSLEETRENLYGESNQKIYYQPVRANCLINRTEQEAADNNLGIEYTRGIIFAFLRDSLVDLNLLLKPGDVVLWDEQYYELKNVASNYLWHGRNPSTLLHTVVDGFKEFGYNVEVLAEGVLSSRNELLIEETRSGNNQRYDGSPNVSPTL